MNTVITKYIWTLRIIDIIFFKVSLTILRRYDSTNRMTNGADPDQTAPLRAI